MESNTRLLMVIIVSVTRGLCISGSACVGNFSASEGILTSPNYPNPYLHNALCEWTVNVPAGHILVNITDLQMETSDTCAYDELAFYDVASSRKLASFCGQDKRERVVEGRSGSMKIRFITDGSVAYRGFKLSWSSQNQTCTTQGFECVSYLTECETGATRVDIDCDTPLQICCNSIGNIQTTNPVPTRIQQNVSSISGEPYYANCQIDEDLNGTEGVLTSPIFEDDIRTENCIWTITIPAGRIGVKITDMELMPGYRCQESLQFYDMESGYKLARFCNQNWKELPKFVEGRSNSMRVKLKLNGDGFRNTSIFSLFWSRLNCSSRGFTCVSYKDDCGNGVIRDDLECHDGKMCCGLNAGCGLVINQNKGSISPLEKIYFYDESDFHDYSNDPQTGVCEWNITVSSGYIGLTINNFISPLCQDRLEIYDLLSGKHIVSFHCGHSGRENLHLDGTGSGVRVVYDMISLPSSGYTHYLTFSWRNFSCVGAGLACISRSTKSQNIRKDLTCNNPDELCTIVNSFGSNSDYRHSVSQAPSSDVAIALGSIALILAAICLIVVIILIIRKKRPEMHHARFDRYSSKGINSEDGELVNIVNAEERHPSVSDP